MTARKKSTRPLKTGPTWSNLKQISPALLPRAKALLLFLDVMKGQSLQHRMEEGLDGLTPQDRGFAVQLLMGSLRFYWPLSSQLSAHLKKPLNKQGKWLEAVLVMGAYQLYVMHIPTRAVIHSMVELVRLFGYDHLTGLTNGVLRSLHRDIEASLGETSVVELDDVKLDKPVLDDENVDDKDKRDKKTGSIPSLKIHDYLNTGHWLYQKIFADWKPHFLPIIEGFQQQPTMYLRVNQRKKSIDEFQEMLNQDKIDIQALPEDTYALPTCIALKQTHNVMQLPGYEDGLVSVQDYSAQAAVAAFVCAIKKILCTNTSASLTVLDACAAPGGKTAGIIDALPVNTQVHAVDIEASRIARTQENMARLGFLGPQLTLECADLAEPNVLIDSVIEQGGYDAILLDAPCSGTGVIGRHPDIQWCRQQDDIEALVQTQRRLLARAEAALKPGGLLMYATCSILKEENSDNVDWYLNHVPTQLQVMPMSEQLGEVQAHGYQRLPTRDAVGDGFYYVLFRKQG